jgi:hypothetical protein
LQKEDVDLKTIFSAETIRDRKYLHGEIEGQFGIASCADSQSILLMQVGTVLRAKQQASGGGLVVSPTEKSDVYPGRWLCELERR